MGLAQITQGKAFKQLMAKLYGFGAAIVIVGALFKIQHWEGAGLMLTIGLLTEAVIFFFSAFEPPHEEVDWSLVYPELAGMHEPGADRKKKKAGDPVAQELDRLLADAKIGPDLIQSLGTGLRSLSENTAKMAQVSNAAVASDEYAKNVQAASRQVVELTASYQKTTQAMQGMGGGISEMLNNLNGTVEDTKRYRDEVSKLAKNLQSLNTVYGNMLTAMNVNNANR
jgi:gliding motility-associated protein GldL